MTKEEAELDFLKKARAAFQHSIDIEEGEAPDPWDHEEWNRRVFAHDRAHKEAEEAYKVLLSLEIDKVG